MKFSATPSSEAVLLTARVPKSPPDGVPHSERSALEEPFGLAGRTGRDTLSLATQGNAGLDEASDMKLRQLKAYSVPRLGRAGDVAAALAWLTSDNGSWVTGQTIPINGGYAAS
jgi:NAD(P)-dependent dehydrogenase (short-subunit alcohol dehydrogenase family)